MNYRKLFIIVIYRPPSGNVAVALNLITEMITKLKENRQRYNFVILGDFNIDMQCKRANPDRDKLVAFCTENELVQLIDTPTRYGPTHSSTIDLILTDSN